MYLFSSLDALQHRNVQVNDTFLGPLLRRDAVPISAPVVLRDPDTGGETWLVKHQEKGAIEASRVLAGERVVYHSPYMLLEDTDVEVAPTMGDAIRRIAGERVVHVEPDLALSRYADLTGYVRLAVDAASAADPEAPTQVLATSGILTRFAQMRDRVRPAAERLIARDPSLAGLAPLLDTWAVDTRFTDIDDLLRSLGVAGVLATSQVNVEELTAEPAGFAAAYYAVDAGEVRVAKDGVRGAVRGRGRARILVEEHDLGIADARALEADGFELVHGSDALAKWREHRDHQNLAAVLVVTHASRAALESAVSWLRDQIAAGTPATERQVKDRYLAAADRFAADLGIPGQIREFFSNCHAGLRTLHPCLASDAVLDARSTSLKLDAGLAVTVDGVTLATSDVASTYLGNNEAQQAYQIFQGIVRDTIANEITVGTVFESLHSHVVDRLFAASRELDRLGFWPSGIDLRQRYGLRNVGHLMGRQESFTSEFRPGDHETIRVGDYGACEIQWPFARHAIGAEDMWIVTPTGPLLLTK